MRNFTNVPTLYTRPYYHPEVTVRPMIHRLELLGASYPDEIVILRFGLLVFGYDGTRFVMVVGSVGRY